MSPVVSRKQIEKAAGKAGLSKRDKDPSDSLAAASSQRGSPQAAKQNSADNTERYLENSDDFDLSYLQGCLNDTSVQPVGTVDLNQQ